MQSVEEKRQSLAELAVQVAGRPRLARSAASLAAKFKPTVAAELERVADLARWLYIYEQPAAALQACQVLHDVPFQGNYNNWTWVEYTLSLEWKLHSQANHPAQAQECIALIRAIGALGTPSQQQTNAGALQNRLTGALLSFKQIAGAELFADKALAKAWRFAQVGELLFMQAVGGSTVWPLAAIEQQLATDVELLRSASR